MKARAAWWRLAISGVVAVVLFILLVNVITQPVATETRSYTAEFTDASGLHKDADVRVRGVRVGKVTGIELKRRDGQSVASVAYTLDKRYAVTADTRLAIKYQALTGLRYVDVIGPSESYSSAVLVTDAPTTMTSPSFDITSLFNGLQPVIATLSPEEVNTFTANAATFLSGDGRGLEPLLESIHRLAGFVANRQEVVATLMRNLSALAASMKGHSQDLLQIIRWVNRPLDGALSVLDEFRKAQLTGPEFMSPLVRMLDNLGLKPGIDVDTALDKAFTNFDDFIDATKLVPVMWDNIQPPPQVGSPEPCSHGRFELPAMMDVLVNGQKVVLCNR